MTGHHHSERPWVDSAGTVHRVRGFARTSNGTPSVYTECGRLLPVSDDPPPDDDIEPCGVCR